MVFGSAVPGPAQAGELGADLLVDFGEAGAADPPGRELDGQRDAVDGGTDRFDFGQRLVGRLKERIGACRSGQEQLRPPADGLVAREVSVVPDRERGERPEHLAVEADRLAAGREDPALAVFAEQRVEQLKHPRQHVFAVVDEEQDLPVPDVTA